MKQGTDEWFKARIGKVTASRVHDAAAKLKNGSYSAARKNYMMQLICERLTGAKDDGFTSAAMERGIELESNARGMYEAKNGVFVDQCGFIDHIEIDGFGASPDGLVGSEGNLEIKCPNTWAHVEFLKTGKIKEEYIYQMHAQMMCAGRRWTDFVSYDDRLPEGLDYKCVRVNYDEELGEYILIEVKKFLEELDKEINNLNKLRG